MKILLKHYKESVICCLPNGKEVEISMVSLQGDEIYQELDLSDAAILVQQSLEFIGEKSAVAIV